MSISISRGTLCEILAATDGSNQSNRAAVFRGLEYDSREIKGGELFIALPGEKSHGEKFLDQAFERGAALALVEDAGLLEKSAHKDFLIAVPDTLKAFWQIAAWWRKETGVPVLGITGSVGKTTVKELSAAILLKTGVGAYAQKSFNNHVGVPYTLCKIHRDHHWAVIEMGMNHAGEISNLSKLTAPNVAAITTVAPAHIEFFTGLDDIARAKLEIVDGLASQAPLVLNHDNAVLVGQWKARSDNRKALFFGTSADVDCQVKDIVTRGLEGVSFTLRLFSEETVVSMSILGAQSALNAACAALSCKSLIPSLTLKDIVSALQSFRAPLMRLNQHELPDGRIVIDDSYNANLASMRAMIELAGDLSKSGKKVGLVLGDMLEQGSFAEQYHQEIGVQAASVNPAFIVAIGKDAKFYVESAQSFSGAQAQEIPYMFTDSIEQAVSFIATQTWDVLMVKASRGVGLDMLVRKIIES